jgi:hypothetical protein
MPCTVDCRSLYLVSLCQPVPGWPAAPVEYPPHSWRGTSQFYRLQHIRSTLTIEQSQAKPTYSIDLHIPRKQIKQETTYSNGLHIPRKQEKHEETMYSIGLHAPRKQIKQETMYSIGLHIPRKQIKQEATYRIGLYQENK